MAVSDLPNLPDYERAHSEPNGVAGRVRPAFPRYRPISADLAIAPSISVVIPARNEAANLPHVFHTIPEWINEVVLVDGRSTDNTVEVARRLRPDIKVVSQKGAGKGDALLAGFAECSGDIIVAMDGDGSTHGSEIIHFVSALVAGADFAKGSRFASGGRSDDITVGRLYGNRLLLALVNRMYGTRYSDLCYGYNAFWSRHLDALAMECDGFEVETLMSIRAVKAGLRIHEVPSHERPRLNGTSNLRVMKDGWRILRVILREKFGGTGPFMPGYQATADVGYLEPVRIANSDAKTDAGLESL
jgi:glycosyltransferase involved in cell wall biosynthesis